jgi:hypothetical protein
VVTILDQAAEQLLGKAAENLTLGSVQDVEHTSQMLLTHIEDCCAASVTSIRQVQRNGAAVTGTGLPYDQPVADEPIHKANRTWVREAQRPTTGSTRPSSLSIPKRISTRSGRCCRNIGATRRTRR